MNPKKKTPKKPRTRAVKTKAQAAKPRRIDASLSEPDALYRTLAEAANDMIFIIDRQGVVLYTNSFGADLLGRPADEIIGRRVQDILDPDLYKHQKDIIARVFETGAPLHTSNQVRFKGREVWLDNSMVPLRDDSGEVFAVMGIARDATAHHQAEEALQENEEKYRNLVERAQDGILIVQDGKVIYANPSLATMGGYTTDEVLNTPLVQYIHPDVLPQILDRYKRRLAGEAVPAIYETDLRHKDGRKVHVEINASLITYQGKSADLVIIRDLTERNQAEETLRENEQRLRDAQALGRIGSWEFDIQSNILTWSDQTFALYERDRALGAPSPEEEASYYSPEQNQTLREYASKAIETGQSFQCDLQARLPSGRVAHFSATMRPIKDAKGRVVKLFGTVQDISERKKIEEALRENEEKYRTLVERARDGILIIQEGVIQYANPKLGLASGYEVGEIQGKRFTQFVHPTEVPNVVDRFRRRLAGEEIPAIYEMTLLRKDGSKFPVEINAGVISYQGKPADLVVVRDLTERRQAEESLREQERFLASVFASIQDGISILDPELRILSVNPTMEQWFAHAMPLVGKKCYAAYYGLTEPCEFCPTRRTLETGRPAYEVVPRRGKDGEVVGWLDLYSFPRMNPVTKEFEGVIEYARDITERKWAEEKVLESELQHRTTLDSMGDAIHVVGWDLRLVLLNERFKGWCRELGLETEVIGRKVFEAFPFLPPTVREEYEQVFRTGEALVTEETSQVGGREIITETRKIPIFEGGKVAQVVTVVHDITKRKRAEEELSRSLQKIQRTLWETIEAMALIVERRDPYTAGHQRRVTLLAQAIAEEMGLSEENIQALRMAGLIHDIGKISVPSEILSKPTPLSDIEFSIIKTHVQVGFDIMKTIEFPWPVAPIVAQHHERMDGSGYPKGLPGKDIFIEARILAVADVIEAMSSYRPYRPAPGLDKALEEITRNRDLLYDPQVVDACLKLFSEKGFSFEPKEEKG